MKMARGNHKEQIKKEREKEPMGVNVISDRSSRSMQRRMRSSISCYVQEDRRGFGTGLLAGVVAYVKTPFERAWQRK